jgi:hypothetical protein
VTRQSSTDDLLIDPHLLAHTAGRVLDAGLALGDHPRTLLGLLTVSGYAFGVLGGPFHRENEAGVEDAQGVLERLGAELQGDADRLYRTAFAAHHAELTATAGMTVGQP